MSTRGGREEPEGRYDDDEYVVINGAQPITRGTVERAYIKYILFFGGRDIFTVLVSISRISYRGWEPGISPPPQVHYFSKKFFSFFNFSFFYFAFLSCF